jgi:hypothetical protein
MTGERWVAYPVVLWMMISGASMAGRPCLRVPIHA